MHSGLVRAVADAPADNSLLPESDAVVAVQPEGMPALPQAPQQQQRPKREQYLKRYRDKKRRRLHAKTIRYHKRKINADKRYSASLVYCRGPVHPPCNGPSSMRQCVAQQQGVEPRSAC